MFTPRSFFKVVVGPAEIPGEHIAIITATPVPTLPEDDITPTPEPTLPEDYSTETPYPTVTADDSWQTAPAPIATAFPTSTADPRQEVDSQVYFTLRRLNANRLVRLPGACVVGLQACPEPETISTPFDPNEIFDVPKAGMPWSPDGRYAALATRPRNPVLEGRTNLFIYDAQANTWLEIYRADQKYIYPGVWSPDGQWLSFTMRSSEGTFQAGVYGWGQNNAGQVGMAPRITVGTLR